MRKAHKQKLSGVICTFAKRDESSYHTPGKEHFATYSDRIESKIQ